MVIKNIDTNGNTVDFKKIENLVLSNKICNQILSNTLENISEDYENEKG